MPEPTAKRSALVRIGDVAPGTRFSFVGPRASEAGRRSEVRGTVEGPGPAGGVLVRFDPTMDPSKRRRDGSYPLGELVEWSAAIRVRPDD